MAGQRYKAVLAVVGDGPASGLRSPARDVRGCDDGPMATWGHFAHSAPELASIASTLLTVPGTGFGYLATVDVVGAPRIHPIMPVWAAESMFAFIGPSPKLRDLERDGRYALHSTGSADVDDELMIAGRAFIRDEDDLRAVATAACPFDPAVDTALVELLLGRVMWANYSPRGVFPPRYVVWRDGDGAMPRRARQVRTH